MPVEVVMDEPAPAPPPPVSPPNEHNEHSVLPNTPAVADTDKRAKATRAARDINGIDQPKQPGHDGFVKDGRHLFFLEAAVDELTRLVLVEIAPGLERQLALDAATIAELEAAFTPGSTVGERYPPDGLRLVPREPVAV